jgi:hypothetical protein
MKRIVPMLNEPDGLWMEEETLSDGSFVYNVTLSKMEFRPEDRKAAERLHATLSQLITDYDGSRLPEVSR